MSKGVRSVQGLTEQVWLLWGHAVCSRLICSSHRPFSRNAQKGELGPTVAWPICFPSSVFLFFSCTKKKACRDPSVTQAEDEEQTDGAGLESGLPPGADRRLLAVRLTPLRVICGPAAVRFFCFFAFPSFFYFIAAFCKAAFSSW